MAEQVVLTNMCMVSDGNGNVLMQDRNDPGWPGLVFPGGHVEPGESFVESIIREVREETGITVLNPRLCGVKQFQIPDGPRYVVFFFKADRFEGELCSSEEGEALWLPREGLLERKCVPFFEPMLKVFENDDISELYFEGRKPAFSEDMSSGETVILTNMCMVSDGKGNVLMQNRRSADWPGWIFPGGHVEKGESFADSVIREVWEETGITVREPRLCGVKQFLTDDGIRYVIFLYKTEKYEGAVRSSDEGEAFWAPRSGLPNEKCSPDFDLMLRIFEDDTISEFLYDGEKPIFL